MDAAGGARLDARLVARLDTRGVRIDTADANTLSLRNVPARADRFSKPRTNLLMQRPRPGLPFIVGVDEDLEYVGPDPAVSRLFAAALRQRGWRVMRIGPGGEGDAQAVLERALRLVGFDGEEPAVDVAPAGSAEGLLSRGTWLTALARRGQLAATVGRESEIESASASLLQAQKRVPVIVSPPGVGKTNLLYGVARRLASARPALELVRLDLCDLFAGTLFDAERELVLAALLKEAASAPSIVLCLERLDLVGRARPEGPLVLNGALERGARIVATALSSTLAEVRALRLTHRLHLLELVEPDVAGTIAVLRAASVELERHHRVEIDEGIVAATVESAAPLQGWYPAKAIALLDAAAARATLAAASRVDLVHVYQALGDFAEQEP